MTAQSSITLHSSWRYVVSSSLGAVVLAVPGTWGVASAGFNVISTALFAAGWVFVLVVLFDVPVCATFTVDGVERRMLGRRQRLVWRAGDQLTRTRPSLLRFERTFRNGGLVLRRGPRRYLLVDRAESADEFDVLVGMLEQVTVADLGTFDLPRPSDGAAPTWLYRRSRWRPDRSPNG